MNRIKPTTQFFLLGMASALFAVALVTLLPIHRWHVLNWGRVQPEARDSTNQHAEETGTCGQLEATEIPLGNPEGIFPDRTERLQKPRWFFENLSEDSLTRFLLSCDLNPIQRKVLLDKQFWSVETNGCVITPPEMIVWYLKGASRRKIYSVLARSPVNFAQRYPFHFLPGTFAEFLHQSGLTDANVERINRLAYGSSGFTCFTDLEAVQAAVTPDEFEKLVEALYQTPALALRLRVAPESDIDALVNYWGKGGRERIIKPLLTALHKVPGGASINVGFLLPPFARVRLYTYPVSWDNPAIEREDCFFTAMNFFNESPDTNLFDWNYAKTVLDEQFVPAAGPPTYGDLVAVRNPSGVVVHVCVFIARNYVFTKNGLDRAQPWVLMRMNDMLRIYHASGTPGPVSFFRHRTAT